MFMTFEKVNPNGQPLGTFMCVNMRTVDYIDQMGIWETLAMPVVDFPTEDDMGFRTPTRRNPPIVRREPDRFVVLEGCVILCTMNNSHQVKANFKELYAMLESLNNMLE